MRIIKFLIALVITIGICFALNRSFGAGQKGIPPLGHLISPFTGFWQNAEGKTFENNSFSFPELNSEVQVFYDERKVPHIFTDKLEDAVYVQGYITARDRLFQMDLSTRSAAGRLSELLGPGLLAYDKRQRRLGMVYGAENTLKGWQKKPKDLLLVEQYVKGINAYIRSLSPRDYPIEYKILDFEPELWTPFRCALMMKSMDLSLCAREYDLESTNALQVLGQETFDFLFPLFNPKNDPIIPPNTEWNFDPIAPKKDSLSKTMLGHYKYRPYERAPEFYGSNNWAVAGSKTASGQPILCNDPHLQLTLPSIWYEIQIKTADMNVYGVSLPGFPGITIGFNENIAWGMTNVGQDLMDWYQIKWTDTGRTIYQYDNGEKEVDLRVEKYSVKGEAPTFDTVRYTAWGPIAYDDPDNPYFDLAVKWISHAGGGNEIRTFRKLGTAKNYDDYRDALKQFKTPPQNVVFASNNGDIGLTVQGFFPLKKPNQGRFVQDGSNPANDWDGFIPIEHNPVTKNPERGFVASANQRSTDDSYPYAYHGGFADYRGRYLNRKLAQMEQISVEDMMKLQNDNYSLKAEEALPLLLNLLENTSMTEQQKTFHTALSNWDYRYETNQLAPAYFDQWWDSFYKKSWDEIYHLDDSLGLILYPESWRTISLLKEDPQNRFFDHQETPAIETAKEIAVESFQEMASSMVARTKEGQSNNWASYRQATIRNLARIPAFSIKDKSIPGHPSTLNANSRGAGPSWRMIVELGEQPKAYGVYPGGQSGNPGSPFYNSMLDYWVEGKYYELRFLQSLPSASTKNILFHEVYQQK